ncbi:hypothetical protein F3Y22_tig00111640pilonHSYRG00069 [Hibiscus syriacus]|uniref:Uncharacterized protein n=1 Tax=Hibiscus syriacus TaxID=106335 RepID=A0A6A2XZ97_HIBSY|nr:hypothetical protein F3Y22_tig00111640pilonHSYRG00069 [Hibiscus syriacus]
MVHSPPCSEHKLYIWAGSLKGHCCSGAPEKPSKSLGNKPIWASISVSKPEQRWMFSSGNSTGFTFSVSATSSACSEPPTPSIVPSLPGSSLHQPKKEHNIQDLRIALAAQADCLLPLFFSFPSSSNVPNHVDASDITFNFGSHREKVWVFTDRKWVVYNRAVGMEVTTFPLHRLFSEMP